MEDWIVYILRCSDNSLYTGITRDITRRINEHNSHTKLASAYTRSRRPVKLVYMETCKNRSEASKREAVIKNMKKSAKEKLILMQENQYE